MAISAGVVKFHFADKIIILVVVDEIVAVLLVEVKLETIFVDMIEDVEVFLDEMVVGVVDALLIEVV